MNTECNLSEDECEMCRKPLCEQCNKPICHTVQSCPFCKIDFVNREPQCPPFTCKYCKIVTTYCGHRCYNCQMCPMRDKHLNDCTCEAIQPINVKCTCSTCGECEKPHKECMCDTSIVSMSFFDRVRTLLQSLSVERENDR